MTCSEHLHRVVDSPQTESTHHSLPFTADLTAVYSKYQSQWNTITTEFQNTSSQHQNKSHTLSPRAVISSLLTTPAQLLFPVDLSIMDVSLTGTEQHVVNAPFAQYVLIFIQIILHCREIHPVFPLISEGYREAVNLQCQLDWPQNPQGDTLWACLYLQRLLMRKKTTLIVAGIVP